MLTTAFLSMWISNSAATAMMLPIVDAILHTLKTKAGQLEKSAGRISVDLFYRKIV